MGLTTINQRIYIANFLFMLLCFFEKWRVVVRWEKIKIQISDSEKGHGN